MNCTQSHDLLQQRLDGVPLAERSALDRHLADCSECRMLHAAAVRLEDGLRLLSLPIAPSGLTADIVSRVAADQRRRRAVRRWAVAGALVAGLLLAVLVGRSANRSEVAKLPATMPEIQPPRTAVAERSPEMPSLRARVVEAGSAMASLTRRAADETVGQTRLLLPEVVPVPPLTTSEPMQPVIDPPTQSLRQAGQGVTAALDPVTSSARRAVSLFLREASAVAAEE